MKKEFNSFYSQNELSDIGFKSIGKNVLISRKASIYNSEQISIGNNVRIDDFCILSGKIVLGNYIHISAYTSLFSGDAGIFIDDFATVSSYNAIYAISDDYSGEYMTNPMILQKFRNVIKGKVHLEKYSIIGSGCTILPDVTISEGCAVGAKSLVDKSLNEWSIYVGCPARFLKKRSKKLLDFKIN